MQASRATADNHPKATLDFRVLQRFVGILGCRIEAKERQRLVKFIRTEIKRLEREGMDPNAPVVSIGQTMPGTEADAIRIAQIRAWQVLGEMTFYATIDTMKDKTPFLAR